MASSRAPPRSARGSRRALRRSRWQAPPSGAALACANPPPACLRMSSGERANGPRVRRRWVTPLGLPVSQPYYKEGPPAVSAAGQTLHDDSSAAATEPSAQKQASAFPPNYIHSLDATHMMMTALECNRLGLAFAGVHDSFWTHAADVPVCRRVIREQFVALYEQELLEALREDMHASLRAAGSAVVLPEPPERGELDLQAVRTSTYFFN